MSNFATPPAATRVWFLFGLSGSGKSFAGDILARHYNWPVYHADDDITAAMREALDQARPFTDAMRNEFFSLLADRIMRRIAAGAQNPAPLIVTQGAYKQKHRDYLRSRIEGLQFVWIDAAVAEIQRRLQQRRAGISAQSAQALLRDFEPPVGDCLHLINDGDEQRVLSQFQAALELTRQGQML